MSFFEDLVGSLAESGAKGLNDISARNQREAEMKMQSDLSIERAKAAEAIRLDLEEQQRQSKQQRLSQQRQRVEEAAPAATQARELSQAQRLAPSVDGNVMDIIKSKLSPSQMKKFYGVDQGPVAELDDKLGIARKEGLYDAEAVLSAERKQTVDALAALRKEALDQQKADAFDERTAAMIKIGAGNNATSKDVAEIRANAPSKGNTASVEKLTTQKSLTLREIEKLQASVPKAKWGTDPDLVDANARLRRINTLLSDKWEKDAVGDSEPAKPAAPAPGKPAAPAANTPGWSIKKK